MAKPLQPSNESLRLAYQEVCRGFESIQSFRVKLLAFLPLASGTGIFLLLATLPAGARQYLPAVGVFGFLTTTGLFFYELHAITDCKHLLICKARLETALHLPTGADNLSLIGPIGAAWLIYPSVMFAWAYVAFVGGMSACVFLLPAAFLLVGFPLFMRKRRDWQKALREAVTSP